MHTVGQQIDPLVPLRADVAVSFFANAGSGDDGAGAGAVRSGEVGGVERRELGVSVRNTPIAAARPMGSPPLSRSDISGWRDAALYPLATGRIRRT